MTNKQQGTNIHLGADTDNEETRDWLDSLSAVIERDGLGRAEYLVDRLIEAGRRSGGRFHTRHTTPYRNTIGVEAQPPYPGDLDLETDARWLAASCGPAGAAAKPGR